MCPWGRVCGGLIIVLLISSASLAGPETVGGVRDSAERRVVRHSLKEIRDQYVVKQQFDYSCGAAALATLLTYYYDDPTSERDVLEPFLTQLSKDDQRQKTQRGFSLLDLKHIAEAKGYRAAGFKLTIKQLMQLAAPVIVFVQPLGYPHFAVLRGIDRGRVFLADPSRGRLRMSIARFLGEWHGIVFVLGKDGEENLDTYPLALPRPEYIQPELWSVMQRWDWPLTMINLAVRSQLR